MSDGEKKFRVTGRFVLIVIVSFFAVTIGVNAVFIYLATSTHPGVETAHAYNRSQEYNQVLAQRALQRQRGWTAAIDAASRADGADVSVIMRDANDNPVSGLTIVGVVRRLRTDQFRHDLAFEEIEAGRYVASVALLGEGAWRVDMQTAFFDGAPFEATREVFIE